MATANAAAAFVTAINQPGSANGNTIRSLNKIDVFYREGGVICDYDPDRTTYDCDMLNVIKNNTGQILIDTSPTTQAIRNLLSSSSAIITFSAQAPSRNSSRNFGSFRFCYPALRFQASFKPVVVVRTHGTASSALR